MLYTALILLLMMQIRKLRLFKVMNHLLQFVMFKRHIILHLYILTCLQDCYAEIKLKMCCRQPFIFRNFKMQI